MSMVYIGPLFGRAAGKYFPLLQTSEDVDKITAQRDGLLAAIKRITDLPKNTTPFMQGELAIAIATQAIAKAEGRNV